MTHSYKSQICTCTQLSNRRCCVFTKGLFLQFCRLKLCTRTRVYVVCEVCCMVQVEGMANAAQSDTGRPTKRAKHSHAIDFSKHFSEEGRLRQYPSLRKIICQFSGADDVVPMHGGLPPSDSFPLSSMLLRLKNDQTVDLTDEQKVTTVWLVCSKESNMWDSSRSHAGCDCSAVLHDSSRLSCLAFLVRNAHEGNAQPTWAARDPCDERQQPCS